MENKLIRHIEKLNENICRIDKNLDPIILLPLLQYSQENKIYECVLENYHVKKLKNFKYEEYYLVSEKIDNYLSELSDEILETFPDNIDLQSISFLLYELLINIYKHSKFNNAYVQINSMENEIILCIIDDGIGIPGSFNEGNLTYKNDCEAIYDSINGKTTDKEKFNLHGRGLNTRARITTIGFGGEMLIASGLGVCDITSEGAKLFFNENGINGTFIILKINNKKVDNLYECIKYEKINKMEVTENE
ncbi:hypothetical protein [Methanobrevibacter sp.]|uniref:hypothetical protein n=1 Tax=Methanobrevibacter sp. TaxID=66852 RepID=UPI00388ED6F3